MDELATVTVAGGFGSSLDPRWLRRLGIPLPSFSQEVFMGNTSLCGAELWHANAYTPARMNRLASEVRTVLLAEEEGFQDIYVDSMHFGG